MTERNPNPADGEPFYYLGVTLQLLREDKAAYAALCKATWVAAWQAPAFHALAQMDCAAARWESACDHLRRALRANTDCNNAIALLVVVLNKLGQSSEAEVMLREARQRDPLDDWLRYLASGQLPAAPQNRIDLALDLTRCGLYVDAKRVFESIAETGDGSYAVALYLLAWMFRRMNDLPR